jgi:hypothetical protein
MSKKIETATLHPEQLEHDRMRLQGIEPAPSGDLAQEVDTADGRREREVQSSTNRGLSPFEG